MRRFALLLFINIFLVVSVAAQTVPTGLRTDLIERTDVVYSGGYPTGMTLLEAGLSKGEFQYAAIASPRPRFSWVVPMEEGARDVMQTAYQIRFYRFADMAAVPPAKGMKQYEYPMPEPVKTLVWDSGKVESGQSTAVPYQGPALDPDTVYGWEVKTWIQAGGAQPQESEWPDLKLFRTAHALSDGAISIEPLVKKDQRPKMVKKLPDGTTFVDFGTAAFGQLRLTLNGGQDVPSRVMQGSSRASKVVLHLGERLKDGRVDREPFGTCRYRRIELQLLPGLHTYTPEILPDWRNTHGDAVLMPDYIGEVMPFRYLEIEGLPYPVTIGEDDLSSVTGAPVRAQDIVRVMVSHPVSNPGSIFGSSEKVLNDVWHLCRYSMEATSFTGYHIDGDRERIPYECDALINQLGWYGVDDSYTLSRRTVDYLLDHPTWPTEWILQTVLMAWYDYLYTGDTRLLEARYDLLKNHTLSDLRQDNGLVSTRVQSQSPEFLQGICRTQPIRDIVDWPQGRGSFGLPGSSPGEADFFEFTDYNAVVNAYHYATLCSMQKIAEALGRSEDRDQWGKDAERFKTLYNKAFLNRKNGIYCDGVGSEHSALHSNLFPLAFGLVPRKQVPSVAEYIIGKGMACSIANAKFLLDALYEAGDADAALALLNATHDRSWYNAIQAGSTITFEAWDDKYKPNQDWNHAWGAAPADLIPHKLLGVEPLTPGWDRIRIRPQVATVERANGLVPTIKGPVSVMVLQDQTRYFLLLVLPPNTQSCIQIPWPKKQKASVTLDGEPVIAKRDATGRYLVLDPVGSGNRSIEIR